MTQKGRSWTLERATVHTANGGRRSNKFSASDTTERPPPHTRQRIWVGGYVRSDGTKVKGHYRAAQAS